MKERLLLTTKTTIVILNNALTLHQVQILNSFDPIRPWSVKLQCQPLSSRGRLGFGDILFELRHQIYSHDL